MNRHTDKEMYVNLGKYHGNQQLKADTHKGDRNMIMLQFDEKWNTIYDSLRHFEDG